MASAAAGAATAVGIAAADGFLLDKVLKGWRPNQFLEGPLKDFIGIKCFAGGSPFAKGRLLLALPFETAFDHISIDISRIVLYST